MDATCCRYCNDAELVRHADGTTRDTMVWHFPHGSAMESTIRVGDYKLVRNFDHVGNKETAPLELFRLYDSSSDKTRRVDIEESNNLAQSMPERTAKMNAQLSVALNEMNASYPYYNPACATPLPNQEKVCAIESHQRQGQQVRVTYKEKGARVTGANLIYTLNGGERYEEWFRMPATLAANHIVTAQLPAGTTHYYFNLIDENQFLRSYPEVAGKGTSFIGTALKARQKSAVAPKKRPKAGTNAKGDRNIPFDRWDTNKDEHLSLEEYTRGLQGKGGLEERFKRFDANSDGTISREEFVRRKR